jgi:S1-C subfamily serine protease
MDPSYEQFFGRRYRGRARIEDQIQRGLGSGVIVLKDGYCVTNHHIVDGAEEMVVEFADGASYQARLVGSDPPSDLAVLKLEISNLKTARIGDSDLVRAGDVAIAIGTPLGVGQTVTAGIISAKGRTTGISDGAFEDFLQMDAPISQGTSGGALVNSAGELIGINSRVLSPSGGDIGIGFAIPVNMLKDVLEQLVKTGRVRRGHLGVTFQTITPDLASALKLAFWSGLSSPVALRIEPASVAWTSSR